MERKLGASDGYRIQIGLTPSLFCLIYILMHAHLIRTNIEETVQILK